MENFGGKFLEEMSYLKSLNPLLFNFIAYTGSWKHFVFVCVWVWVSMSLYLSFCVSSSPSMSSPDDKLSEIYGLEHHMVEINGDVTFGDGRTDM